MSTNVCRVMSALGRDAAAVFVGGIVGTAMRWGLDSAVPHRSDELPVSTLVVNVVGSLVLAYLVAGLWTRPLPSWVKAGAGPGLLGTFTTFSAVVVSLTTLGDADEYVLAALYLILSIVLGAAAVVAGWALGERLHGSARPQAAE